MGRAKTEANELSEEQAGHLLGILSSHVHTFRGVFRGEVPARMELMAVTFKPGHELSRSNLNTITP